MKTNKNLFIFCKIKNKIIPQFSLTSHWYSSALLPHIPWQTSSLNCRQHFTQVFEYLSTQSSWEQKSLKSQVQIAKVSHSDSLWNPLLSLECAKSLALLLLLPFSLLVLYSHEKCFDLRNQYTKRVLLLWELAHDTAHHCETQVLFLLTWNTQSLFLSIDHLSWRAYFFIDWRLLHNQVFFLPYKKRENIKYFSLIIYLCCKTQYSIFFE